MTSAGTSARDTYGPEHGASNHATRCTSLLTTQSRRCGSPSPVIPGTRAVSFDLSDAERTYLPLCSLDKGRRIGHLRAVAETLTNGALSLHAAMSKEM